MQQLSLSNLAINKGKTPEATRQTALLLKPRVVKMQAEGIEQIKAKKKNKRGKIKQMDKGTIKKSVIPTTSGGRV